MREQQFDLLRVLCAFAVVVMHVSAQFIAANKGQDSYCLLYSLLYATVFRFAVPCFIMLSGAFILSNSKNANFLYFYNKSFLKFFVPVSLLRLFKSINTFKAYINSTTRVLNGRKFSYSFIRMV